jgi:hypothetical protein
MQTLRDIPGATTLDASAVLSEAQKSGLTGKQHKEIKVADLPQVSERVSEITCHEGTHACIVRNIYLLNNSVHAFLGTEAAAEQSDLDLDNTVVYFGIGFNSPRMRFVLCSESDPSLFRTLTHYETVSAIVEEASGNNVSEVTIPLYVHFRDPPELAELETLRQALSPDAHKPLMYHSYPVVVFSIMWDNLFRTLYGGVGSWFTALQYETFFPDYQRTVLIDPGHPSRFADFLAAASSYPLTWMESLEDGVYKAMILGISRDALVQEIEVEKHFQHIWGMRALAFRLFSERIKSVFVEGINSSVQDGNWHMNIATSLSSQSIQKKDSSQGNRVNITFLRREGTSRRILNFEDLLFTLQNSFPYDEYDVQDYNFENMTLGEQMSIIHNTDILVGMHGAGLAHVMFMRPNTHVIELHPYKFRKMIFQNIAKIMDVRYVFWQNTRQRDTVFHWEDVEQRRFTKRSKQDIIQTPVDWHNMDSKNYWRNQDTKVNVNEMVYLIQSVENNRRNNGEETYLMFMPWEQLNNQVTGFKSACAVASLLNRTVVLPHLGYRIRWDGSTKDKDYRIWDFSWRSFEAYFDLEQLTYLPCHYITFDNFFALNNDRDVGPIHWHDLDVSFSDKQLMEYYKDVAQLPFSQVAYNNDLQYQLSEHDIVSAHGEDHARVLSLGAMFRYFDFGKKLVYPLVTYTNFMENPLYADISSSLEFATDIKDIAMRAIQKIPDKYVAIHVRRGDYEQKCAGLGDTTSAKKCWPSFAEMGSIVAETFPESEFKYVYVCTNQPDLEKNDEFLKAMGRNGQHLIFQGTIIAQVAQQELDPIHEAMIDMEISIHADGFIGNLHSSFSRSIVEKRKDIPLFF